VVRALKTSPVSVGRWKMAMDAGGVKALAAKPVPGRPPKRDQVQQGQRMQREHYSPKTPAPSGVLNACRRQGMQRNYSSACCSRIQIRDL